MKNILATALSGALFLLAQPMLAQDALLDKLADFSCECISKKDTDLMSKDDLQMQLGFCIMEAVGANQAAFEKEYGELNPSDQFAMTKLGEQIGMKMAFKCPNVIMRLAGKENARRSQNHSYKSNRNQDTDILDRLAGEACDCIMRKDIQFMSSEDLEMQLGFCIMGAVGDNQAAFEKEYGQLDPSNQSAMTRLGEQIGMKMAFKCPDFFALLSDKVQNYDQGDNDKYSKNPQAQNFPRGHLESKVLKGSGSGVIISKEGIIATNAHVVREASNVEVIIRVNGIVKTYSASVLVKDESNDIALLKIYPADLQGIPDVPFSISRRVDIGERVFTLGYPLSQIMGDNIKLTDGIISSNTGVKDDIKYYQISVPVQPGNSGGPLFDENGNLAGLTTAKLNESAVGANIENVNYAIKANYLLNVIDMFSDQFSFKFNSSLSDLELKDQVKVLKNYVCLIKIY